MYHFTIRLDRDGYRARFFAPNGELIWWTEAYVSRTGAENAVALIRRNAASAPLL